VTVGHREQDEDNTCEGASARALLALVRHVLLVCEQFPTPVSPQHELEGVREGPAPASLKGCPQARTSMTNQAHRRVAHGNALWAHLTCGLLVPVALSCATALSVLGRRAPPPEWDRMVASEEAILLIAPEIKRLNHSVLNLRLPDESTRGLFGDNVEVFDLVSAELTARGPLGTVGLASVGDVGEGRHDSREELALWRPLLDQVESFEHAKFEVIQGHLLLDE